MTWELQGSSGDMFWEDKVVGKGGVSIFGPADCTGIQTTRRNSQELKGNIFDLAFCVLVMWCFPGWCAIQQGYWQSKSGSENGCPVVKPICPATFRACQGTCSMGCEEPIWDMTIYQ